ncbi:hypothetical protein HDU76_010976, partial [Blyttiomyces sp. JEL0837]
MEYGDVRDLMRGYVSPNLDTLPKNAPSLIKFNSTWNNLGLSNPRFRPITQLEGNHKNNVAAYDCTKILLLGVHKVCQDNPQYTPEMLANGSLNQYLLPPIFANTGYTGLTYDPTLLDNNGDLK